MKFFRTLALIFKQNLKKPSFYLVLLLMPVFTFLLTLSSNQSSDDVLVGFSVTGKSDDKDLIIDTLEDAEGLFTFKYYKDTEEMAIDVVRGKLECAYEIPSDLYDTMAGGKKRRLVTAYTSPSSTMRSVIDEVLYSHLFKEISKRAVIDYITTKSPIAPYKDDAYTEQDLVDMFENFAVADSTFAVTYEKEPDEIEMKASDVLFTPLRGILAHMVLLAGLGGGLAFYKDPNNYAYRQFKVRLASVCIPVLTSAIMAVPCLMISGTGEDILKESLAILALSFLVILFTLLLTFVVKKQLLYTAFLPLYLLFSLLLTPVFMDLTIWMPVLKYVSYLFLPKYYLGWF